MIIFIKTLTGKTVSLDVDPNDTIGTVKSKIFEREGVPVNQQRVLFAGKELSDDKTIDGSGIKKETILHLVLKKKEENMRQLTAFEKKEMKVAQSDELRGFYNDSAGLNDEVKIYRDSESKFDKFDNPAGEGFDLGRDGQFKDFTVLIGQWYSFPMDQPITALRRKGFTVIHTTKEKQFLENLNKADVAWIISGSNWENNDNGKEFVQRVYEYSCKLGGLFIFGDNDPFYVHANAVLAQMFKYTQCFGSDPGGMCMKIGPPTEKGTFGTHLITSGIISLFEGITICYTTDPKCPLKTLASNSSGHSAIQFADHEILPSENCGRLVLDHGFTKLYNNWDDAGTARYVVNATVWLLALEHKTRIGVPITARAKTKDPLRKETMFECEQLSMRAPSVADLMKKLADAKTPQENPVRINFRIGADTPSGKLDKMKFEWSKSKGTDQRRPIAELEKWVASKKTGHFYVYM